MTVDEAKREAGRAACRFLRSGMRVGLGTGSTAWFTTECVGEMFNRGTLRDIVVVPTSVRTAEQAQGYGLPLVDLNDSEPLDVTIDGADEVDPRMTLIKGLGGALLREKIVACASKMMVVVVDPGKLVAKLGTKAPLPVEVEPFGWKSTMRQLSALGCTPEVRKTKDGQLFRTDGGHYTVDCRFPNGIEDAARLEAALKAIPGAFECGLFVGIAKQVVIGGEQGVQCMRSDGSLAPFAEVEA